MFRHHYIFLYNFLMKLKLLKKYFPLFDIIRFQNPFYFVHALDSSNISLQVCFIFIYKWYHCKCVLHLILFYWIFSQMMLWRKINYDEVIILHGRVEDVLNWWKGLVLYFQSGFSSEFWLYFISNIFLYYRECLGVLLLLEIDG